MSDTLTGQVERVIFHNAENGWTVLTLSQGGNGSQPGLFTHIMKPRSVVGVLPKVHPGQQLELTGEWATHPQYGRQFKVTACKQTLPATIQGIEAYLSSDLIAGIGPEYARRIVERFGEDTLKILDFDIDRLSEVEGIGPGRLKTIAASWAEHKDIKDIMIWLQGHGISQGLAAKIRKEYGDRSVEVLEKNPYILTRIHGVGFLKADQVAQALGIALDAPERIQAGLVYTLEQGAKDGHCYLTDRELYSKAVLLLKLSQNTIEAEAESLTKDDRVVMDDDRVYLSTYHRAEVSVAERIKFLVNRPPAMTKFAEIDDWPVYLAKFQEPGVTPTETQLKAVESALLNRVTVITGGPGTGKTTITRLVVDAARDKGYSIALCSPTGRAAKRLSEATRCEASTIHRLLEYSPARGWGIGAGNPLWQKLLIVDESSMLDIRLMYRLVDAINSEMHVVFVGDIDQLPSVGAGVVLGDLIKSGMVSVIELDVIFRQAKNSHIILNSHRINEGKMPVWNDGKDSDTFLFSIDDPGDLADMIVNLVTHRIPQKFGFSPDDIQVLAPMYAGKTGIHTLNERLQSSLNPFALGKDQKQFGKTIMRVGDKLIQTRNDYDVNIMNGDAGTLLEINTRRKELIIDFGGQVVAIEFGKAGSLVHAFAISIHRAQGSEYPVVVMPVHKSHFIMLARNLLYTGVTRAKKLMVVVGQKQAIAMSVRNNKVEHRNSFLSERLRLTTC